MFPLIPVHSGSPGLRTVKRLLLLLLLLLHCDVFLRVKNSLFFYVLYRQIGNDGTAAAAACI